MKDNQKGEIVTILAIASVVAITAGVTILANVLTSSKQTTQTKAQVTLIPCTQFEKGASCGKCIWHKELDSASVGGDIPNDQPKLCYNVSSSPNFNKGECLGDVICPAFGSYGARCGSGNDPDCNLCNVTEGQVSPIHPGQPIHWENKEYCPAYLREHSNDQDEDAAPTPVPRTGNDGIRLLTCKNGDELDCRMCGFPSTGGMYKGENLKWNDGSGCYKYCWSSGQYGVGPRTNNITDNFPNSLCPASTTNDIQPQVIPGNNNGNPQGGAYLDAECSGPTSEGCKYCSAEISEQTDDSFRINRSQDLVIVDDNNRKRTLHLGNMSNCENFCKSNIVGDFYYFSERTDYPGHYTDVPSAFYNSCRRLYNKNHPEAKAPDSTRISEFVCTKENQSGCIYCYAESSSTMMSNGDYCKDWACQRNHVGPRFNKDTCPKEPTPTPGFYWGRFNCTLNLASKQSSTDINTCRKGGCQQNSCEYTPCTNKNYENTLVITKCGNTNWQQ